MREAMNRNWEYFIKGFLVRITSPMVMGFIAIVYLLGGFDMAIGFTMILGVLGGLRAVRRKTLRNL